MTRLTADVAVIGGGIHGCSAALHLSLRGFSVIQIEQDAVGQHASGVNAGGVRQLLRHPAEIPLSLASMQIWQTVADLVGDDCGFHRKGQVAVAESDADLARLTSRYSLIRALGYTHEELLNPQELFEIVPALSRGCVGGLVSRGDGMASPYQATVAFARAATAAGTRRLAPARATAFRRQGATWRIETTAGAVEAGWLVNCGGAWGGAVAAALGEPVPIQPIAPMMMVTTRMDRFLDPVVIGTGRRLTFKQMPNGTVVIGGGHLGRVDLEAQSTELEFTRLAASARTVLDLFPVMKSATVVRCWSGVEARMPDDLPVLGPSKTHEQAFHAFAFCAHGFQLGPVTGAVIADVIETGRSLLPIDGLAITRFDDPAFGARSDELAGVINH